MRALLGIVGTLLVVCTLALTTPVIGAEQRCTELGANCLCAEDANVSSYTTYYDGYGYRSQPNQTNSKKCTFEVPNYPIFTQGNDLVVGSDATVLAKLPTGHSVSYYVRRVTGNISQWWFGQDQLDWISGAPVKRVAMRWYQYWSPDFQFKDEGACENQKLAVPGGTIVDHPGGPSGVIQFYSWAPFTNHTQSNCCFAGPNYNYAQGPSTPADWKDKWHRIELVARNRQAGSGNFTVQMYWQRVTAPASNNILLVNSALPDFGAGPYPWGTTEAYNLNPVSTLQRFALDLYRQGTCNGWAGISHLLIAGWNTDDGQTIGAATEIEGGGVAPPPDVDPPSAPF